jgi:signal transduction histidine kinase
VTFENARLNFGMNFSRERDLSDAGAETIWKTLWPRIAATDSELQRKRKTAVRCAQLAVTAMVVVPVAGTIVTGTNHISITRVVCLMIASLIYIPWSLYGLRDVMRLLFREPDNTLSPAWQPRAPLGSVVYFAVQLTLAGLICYASGDVQQKRLAWLVLLPPVAHSIILVRWPGVVLVSLLTLGILSVSVAQWYGWQWVPGALLAFSFALIFTIVFTLLAVSAEKSRSEMERLANELSAANRKLREYAVQAEELAATRERNRLAREIHDSLGHYLTVVNVQIEAARTLWDRDSTRAQNALAKAQSLTREGLQDIRRSVAALRTSPLDNTPLIDALRQLVAESQTAGLAMEFKIVGETRPLSPLAEQTLYRAGQEGLTNVRKHAQASRVAFMLDFQASNQVCLLVNDNGVGATQSVASGFGLVGLRERAQILGGEARVNTSPNAGFTLEIVVPG